MPELISSPTLWLIPLPPLAAAVVIALFGKVLLRGASHWPCCVALAVSCVAAWTTLLVTLPDAFEGGGSAALFASGYKFIDAGVVDVSIGLRADAMAALMLAMITTVSFLVSMFASGYMKGDPGYSRFFAVVSLFVFSMCMLVLADNFVQLFVFWEGVGLCSYLLIGHWFQKPAAAAAATKAFVVNRIGDFGLLMGLMLIATTFGSLTFDDVLFNQSNIDRVAAASPGVLFWVCVGLLVGAIGKSAQAPLHVWLPDAMEGPTPVSALIHAATMVTAGVYLVARSTPLFVHAPEVQVAVAAIGAFTAFFAALIALSQSDLKRVLAYSTVSQLGYMFMALGVGAAGGDLALAGATAAIFHLITHGCFKALLFLASGSVMHSMGDVIDMRRFSGLRSVLPTTHATFLVGALALAGAPLLAGFWSKDEILAVLSRASEGERFGDFFNVIFWCATVTAFLTALYGFRAYFLTFWGEVRFPAEAGEHPHDAPPSMARPLWVLAFASIVVGCIGAYHHLFAGYFDHAQGFSQLAAAAHPHGYDLNLMLGSSGVAIAGIVLAFLLFGTSSSWRSRSTFSFGGLRALCEHKFFCDELYRFAVVGPLRGIASLSAGFDRYVLAKVVRSVGVIPRQSGNVLARWHNGEASGYTLLLWGGLLVYLVVAWRSLL
jgi:NADH-quinone oxidoreductase subunit L